MTEDRKTLGLNLLDDIKTTTVAAALQKITKNLVVDDREEYTVAENYRKQLRTKTPSVNEGVSKLSGGNQQKVVLAKWLFTDPDLLILDEPTRGIDVGAKYEIYGIIQRLADQGKGVIVISSELPELLGISDRIYTIFEGVHHLRGGQGRRHPGEPDEAHDLRRPQIRLRSPRIAPMNAS